MKTITSQCIKTEGHPETKGIFWNKMNNNYTGIMTITTITIMASIALMIGEIPLVFADELVIITNEATNKDCKDEDSCYSNSALMISMGQTVTWQNDDSSFHSVKSGSRNSGTNGLFASDMIMPGESFSYNFTQPGLFGYYCPTHPWMEGAVYVK